MQEIEQDINEYLDPTLIINQMQSAFTGGTSGLNTTAAT